MNEECGGERKNGRREVEGKQQRGRTSMTIRKRIPGVMQKRTIVDFV